MIPIVFLRARRAPTANPKPEMASWPRQRGGGRHVLPSPRGSSGERAARCAGRLPRCSRRSRAASCFSPREPACAFSCATDGTSPAYACGSDNLSPPRRRRHLRLTPPTQAPTHSFHRPERKQARLPKQLARGSRLGLQRKQAPPAGTSAEAEQTVTRAQAGSACGTNAGGRAPAHHPETQAAYACRNSRRASKPSRARAGSPAGNTSGRATVTRAQASSACRGQRRAEQTVTRAQAGSACRSILQKSRNTRRGSRLDRIDPRALSPTWESSVSSRSRGRTGRSRAGHIKGAVNKWAQSADRFPRPAGPARRLRPRRRSTACCAALA